VGGEYHQAALELAAGPVEVIVAAEGEVLEL
jgi:hypothetical protein